MFIREVLSYGGAWERLALEYHDEFKDIEAAIAQVTLENIALAEPIRHASTDAIRNLLKYDACWFNAIGSRGWVIPEVNPKPQNEGRRTNLRSLGQMKNHVSIAICRFEQMLSRWLYTLAPLGSRIGTVEIPIAIILLPDAYSEITMRGHGMNKDIFTSYRDELIALSPLSHPCPFIILGVSLKAGGMQIVDLEREHGVNFRQVVVNRSIEFPAQYHQAGLGVLTFFGTVLREKCPDQNANVKIEQEGLKVRMIIESENGDREVIEKVLHDYEQVVRGEMPPHDFIKSQTAIIELKNELRFAQLRIENQRDFINLQANTITSLRDLIGHSLSRAAPPISINFQPNITVSSNALQYFDISTKLADVAEDIDELLTEGVEESLRMRLYDLRSALNTASEKSDSQEVRDSSGLAKLKSLLQEATTTGTNVNEAMTKLEDGIGTIQNIGRKYNAIAEWCGAPQIPRALLGKDD